MAGQVLNDKYLPFTREELRDHFAPVGKAPDDRHLHYFENSLLHLEAHVAVAKEARPSPAAIRIGRQLEKDERFWIVSALMSLYHRPPGQAARAKAFADLLQQHAHIGPPPGFSDWPSALEGNLKLYFEVNLPSPPRYREWLENHLDERVLFPYVREAADRITRTEGTTKPPRLEGATKADAMLLAPDTGVAVIFEAKVLSDVSTHITFDVARNQLARNIDVMLEPASGMSPLDKRQPERTSLVLITPDLFRSRDTGLRGSRLYGWLMDEYKNPHGKMLAQHLANRNANELAGVADRLGWASWEDLNEVVPSACSWLTT